MPLPLSVAMCRAVAFRSLFCRAMSDSDETIAFGSPQEHVVVLPIEEAFRVSESQVIVHSKMYRDDHAATITAPFILYLPVQTRRVVYVTVDVVVDRGEGSDIEAQAPAGFSLQRQREILMAVRKKKNRSKRKGFQRRRTAAKPAKKGVHTHMRANRTKKRAPHEVNRRRTKMRRMPFNSMGARAHFNASRFRQRPH